MSTLTPEELGYLITSNVSAALAVQAAEMDALRAALSASAEPEGWVLMTTGLSVGVFSAGATCPPGWSGLNVRPVFGHATPRPAPAEPQPIDAWSIVRMAESAGVTGLRGRLAGDDDEFINHTGNAVVTAVRAALSQPAAQAAEVERATRLLVKSDERNDALVAEVEALRADAALLQWILSHPETCAEELEDACALLLDPRTCLEQRKAGIEAAARAAQRPSPLKEPDA